MKKIFTLHIALNNYHPKSNVSPLSGCGKDIHAFRNFLKKYYSCHPIHEKVLINEAATYANIVRHFGKAHLLKATKGDTVLIQYSGHGAREKAAPEFAYFYPEGMQETWVCYDSRLEGKYDLADKELAVLLQRIAAKGVHVVVIADCCHSGSGTRELGTMQLEAARQWKDRPEVRPLVTYLKGHFVDNIYVPSSPHILLAACHKRQQAHEVSGGYGNFTSHLLQVLEAHEGNISYAALFDQTHILMRRFSNRQTPQFETYGFFNGYAQFLGIGTPEGRRNFQVWFEKQNEVWTINAGALQGITTDANEATTFDIYENKQVVSQAQIRIVQLNESEITLTNQLEKNTLYRARMTSIAQKGMTIAVKADGWGKTKLKEALHPDFIAGGTNQAGYRPLYFELLKGVTDAPYQLTIQNHQIQLTRVADGLMIAQANDLGMAAFRFIFQKLEHICRWEKMLTLDNPLSHQKEEVALYLVELDTQGKVLKETNNVEVMIDILMDNEQERKVPFRLEARNQSAQRWYAALFYFSANYGIHHEFFNEEIIPNSTVPVMEFNQENERYAFALYGKQKATDIFKLVVSKQKIKQEQLGQEAISLGEIFPGSVNKGVRVPKPTNYEKAALNDWFSHQITCQSVARKIGF